MLDFDHCYRAAHSRDARFDGRFVVGVRTTGIYCRPSCPARTPHPRNVTFFPTTAAAQQAGLRACRRCLPDAAPGSPEWDLRADVVGRVMRLVADGLVDRAGVGGLAARVGFSERHLHRVLVGEVGAGPLALARAQRAHTARALLEQSDLTAADIAFAAGFGSVRQFNDTIRAVYAATPRELRRRRRPRAPGAGGVVVLRLPYRPPLAGAELLDYFAARAVPGVEAVVDGTYRRTLRLPHGPAVVALTPEPDAVRCELRPTDVRDVATAARRCRRLFDLDADPMAVADVLAGDAALAPLVARRPGLRLPGSVDAAETALRAVLGQQVSVAAARTTIGKLVARFGTPLPEPDGTLTHLFPAPAVIADADPAALPVPGRRARALGALAAALVAAPLDGGTDRAFASRELQTVPGIGPWTAAYVAMRGLGDPDAFPAGDLALRRVAARLGIAADETGLARRAERWRPFRAYAAEHLWTVGRESS